MSVPFCHHLMRILRPSSSLFVLVLVHALVLGLSVDAVARQADNHQASEKRAQLVIEWAPTYALGLGLGGALGIDLGAQRSLR